jgi:hypothetical protein
MHYAGPRFRHSSRDENRQSQQRSNLPRLHAKCPLEPSMLTDWVQTTTPPGTHGGENITPWRFVGIGGTRPQPQMIPRAGSRPELLHVLTLPDFDRADSIGSYWGTPRPDTFAELLIDCEEDRVLRAALAGTLREAESKRQWVAPMAPRRI